MEAFLALPEEKQNAVVDAAMLHFGKMGYKKASARDIATAAGISKGMIFHYFGSKKNMYFYLIDLAFQELIQAFAQIQFDQVTDFFDRIESGTKIKLDLIRKRPAMLNFLTSIYFETDPEVAEELGARMESGTDFQNNFVFTEIDRKKFKETVDPELVLTILVKYAEGYVSGASFQNAGDLDAMEQEFLACLKMMKANFYKEEYL